MLSEKKKNALRRHLITQHYEEIKYKKDEIPTSDTYNTNIN